MVTTATELTVPTADDDDDGPGWTSRWIRNDPVRAIALVIILVNVIIRAYVGSRGFLAQDDFYLAEKAFDAKLTAGFLLTQFNNHLMPVPMLYTWWITRTLGYVYWPYLTAMIVGQFVLGVSFFRLLRLMIPARWGLLIPLSVLLFSPLNLETTSWWVFGMYMLPMELAMVWAIGSQVKYGRTRRKRHLATLVAALAFGLLFAEKTVLIAPLLFGVTACFMVKGSLGRSIWRALTRYWPTWLVLAAASAAFFVVYQRSAAPGMHRPESVDQVMRFYTGLFRDTLIPGLFGGPWQYLFGGVGAPVVQPGTWLHIAAVIAFFAFVVFTSWRRPVAGRAWMLLFGYALLAASLIAATRLGQALSDLAGLVTRYAADITVVAALCIGVAMFGLRDLPDRRPVRRIAWFGTPAGRRIAWAAGSLSVVVLAFGAGLTTLNFAHVWSHQPGRDFLAVSHAELAKAPPGTVLLDQAIPPDVLAAYYAVPYNMQSKLLSVPSWRPTFVSGAEAPRVLDQTGHLRPAWVQQVRQTVPGPGTDCGYEFKGPQTIRMPLDGPLVAWPWAFHIGYLSDNPTTITVRLGQKSYEFPAKAGLHEYFFTLESGGDALDVTVSTGANVCVNQITVGNFAPWLL